MSQAQGPGELRVACDAMCGGLARWLRLVGVDCTYTPGIDDGVLVKHALREQRLLISSDGKLFERRLLAQGEVAGLRLPVGLTLEQQFRFVAGRLGLRPSAPRCTVCNGELDPVGRDEVADVVPARSLIWTREFFRCGGCGHVFWRGSHWRRIKAVLGVLGADQASPSGTEIE